MNPTARHSRSWPVSETSQPNLPSPIPADAKRGEGDTGAQHRDEAGRFKEFSPTDEQRSLVKGFAAVGLPQPQIATYLEIDKVTLLKYFRKELDTGMIEANSKIASTLYQKAISGNIAAAIFWAKARMGWSERVIHANDPDNPMPGQTVNVNNSVDLSSLNDEELEKLAQITAKLEGRADGDKEA